MIGELFARVRGIAPGGPSGVGAEDRQPPPAGDASTHTNAARFDRAASRQMRAFANLEQPPQGVPYTDPRHNLYMPTRFAMSWFGGLFPVQILPDWSTSSAAPSARFHAPLTPVQVRDRQSRTEKRKGTQFPTAVVNPSQYLRMGGGAPIGIGPAQVQEFKASTDALRPQSGNGAGSTYPNAILMNGGFAAET